MDELKKFKHLLLPLAVIFFAVYGVKSYKSSVAGQLAGVQYQYDEIDKVVRENDLLEASKTRLANVKTPLLEERQDAFLSNVLTMATSANLIVLSSKKGVDVPQGRRALRRAASQPNNSAIKDYNVVLEVVGDSTSLGKFLAQIDLIEKYVLVSSFTIEELQYGDVNRERYDGAVIKSRIVIKAKAMEKVDL